MNTVMQKSVLRLGLPIGAALLLLLAGFLLLPADAANAAPTGANPKILVNEFYRNGSFAVAGGDEWVELLIVQDMTATDLQDFYVGDSTSSTASKYAAYRFANMGAIAANFPQGTIIVVGGGATTEDTSYDPPGNDWNIVLSTAGTHLTPNANVADFAGTDVVWVDLASTGSTIDASGFAVNWDSTPGVLGTAADVLIGVPANTSGAYLSADLAGATTPGNWMTSIPLANLTKGEPNGGDNAAYIEDLRGGGLPAFAISKSAPGMVAPSEAFTYTLTLTNSIGITATNLVITDALPVSTTFVAASDGGVLAGDVVSWTVTSLPDGGILTRTFQVIAPALAGNDIVNDDYRVYASNWMTPALGAPVTTTISPLELSVAKSAPATYFYDGALVYTIELQTTGVATATDVIVTDTLPMSVTYVSDKSGITPTLAGQTITWDFGDVPPQTLLSFDVTTTVSVSVPNGTLLTNLVTATTTTVGDLPDNNTAQAATTVYHIVPIAEARAGSNGQVFFIEGQVTSVPGTYNALEWAVQDASGGIAVYYSPAPAISLGDTVRLMATRGMYSNQEQMVAPVLFFEKVSAGPEVTPIVTQTGAIPAGSTEGWLIQVQGLVSGLAPCSGGNCFYVNDGSGAAYVYVDNDTGINLTALGIVNGSNVRLTGFSSQFSSSNPAAGFQLKPRRTADVVRIADEPAIAKLAPATVAPGAVFTYTIRVENATDTSLDNVTIVDDLPANVDSVFPGNLLRYNLGSLPAHSQVQYSFVVTATNQVTVVVNSNYYVTATQFATPTYGMPAVTLVVSGSLQIHDIQGAGNTSPFAGQTVTDLRGIVTLVQSSGFYMQCATPDNTPLTSEGIYVYTGSAPSVVVGNDVEVDGTVVEYNGMTEITYVTSVSVVGAGTIPPTSVTFPLPEGTDLEPVESMLVAFPQTLTVNQNYFQGRYGQVTLAFGRMYNPTNGNGLGDTLEYNRRRMIILDDGLSSQNPNPIPYIGEDDTLRAGDSVDGVTGIVDYGLVTADNSTRFYRLQPTASPTFTRVNDRTATPEAVGGSLQVASFNVLNYFNGDGLGGGFPTPRGANTPEEFVRQRTKIITALLSLDADIVGLMEIENDDTDAQSAIQDLVNGLNDATAPGTYAFVVEPAPGDDEIKVAMIYKPGVVTPVGAALNYQVTTHPSYTPLFDRPPLAQTFQVNASGEVITVIVNHFKSKGSCPSTPGSPDADYGQGCWNVKRVAQAEGLLDFVAQLQDSSGDRDVLVIGDLNAYGAEDPILALADGGLVDQLAARVPAEDRYSYVFDGFAGYLDQGLATVSLNEQVTDATIWHINADEPSVIDYNTEFKPQDLYTPTPYRSSDHDPVLIGLNLRPAALSIEKTVTPDADVLLGGVVTYTVVLSNHADVAAYGILLTDTLPAEVTFGGWVAQGGATYANGTITWGGSLPANENLTLVFTASVRTSPSLYGQAVVNTVEFTSENDGADFDQATFVVAEPELLIAKTVALAALPVQAGDVVTYTIVVRNDGAAAALGVHITDTLPVELDGDDLDVTVDIPAGEAYTATITATVRHDLPAGGAILVTNTAYYAHLTGNGSAQAAFTIGAVYRLYLPVILKNYAP